MDSFVKTYYYELLALLPVLMMTGGLFFAVWMDPYIGKLHKRIMTILLWVVLSLIAQNYLDYLLCVTIRNIPLRRMVSSYGFIVRPLTLLLFLHIVSTQKHVWEWCLVFVNTVLYTASAFWDICFTIDHYNSFQAALPGLHYTCTVTSMVLLADLLYRTIRENRLEGKKENLLPVFVSLAILLGFFLDSHVGAMLQAVSFLTIAIVVSCSLYYSWLHLKFVREHEQALQAEMRIQIMMQQIQPHFLYNTLYTIQVLCETDPQKASEITGKFALYLRQNLESLSQSANIPIDKEMEHTRTYVGIEMIRFSNIRVEEDLQDHDFSIPALTVQPLVENAIRHGVRIRKPGIVKISTRRTEKDHEIIIRDNGVGFDVKKLKESDGMHIGIANVRERIESQCKGTLVIDSRIGEGTTVTIRIPVQ